MKRIIVVAFALACATSCNKCGPGPVGPAVHAVIDCLQQDQGKLGSLSAELLPLLQGDTPNWATFEAKAKAAGISIGGCVAAVLIQKYLAPAPGNAAPSPENGQNARATMDKIRASFNGATFKTDQGEL